VAGVFFSLNAALRREFSTDRRVDASGPPRVGTLESVTETLEVPRTHVHFTFTRAGGWPPVAGECLWATPLGGNRYLIDNIPFFAAGIALNDTVEARIVPDGELEFVRRVIAGGHSTLRVSAKPGLNARLQQQLGDLGCGIEGTGPDSLFAVDVPPETDLRQVLSLCKAWLADGSAEYETGWLAT
jgi:hypothetical protein